MKLTVLNLSFPIKNFSATIEHFTPRNSTAIEWAILESVHTIAGKTKFQDVSIERFFADILQIADPNMLVKPCIINLMDMGALERSDDIFDSVDLGDVRMGILKLTDEGQEMQQRGLLPGETLENEIRFSYNFFNNEIFNAKTQKLFNDPQGVEIIDTDDNLENVEMPTQTVRQYLLKNPSQYHWMNNNTEIRNIRDSTKDDEKVKWMILPKNIIISGNGKISIENNDSTFIEDKVLAYLAEQDNSLENQKNNTNAIKKIEFKDIDQECSHISLARTINSLLSNEIAMSTVCVINSSIANIDLSQLQVKPGRIVIIAGADKFECRQDSALKSLIVKIPSDNELDSILFASAAKNYRIHSAGVYTNHSATPLTVVLQTKETTFDFTAYCVNLVQKYVSENKNILFLLQGVGKTDLFFNQLANLFDDPEINLLEKGEALTKILETGQRYFGRNILSTDQEKRLLFHNWAPQNITLPSIQEQIHSLLKSTYFKNRPWALQYAISQMMDHASPVKSFEDFMQFIEFATTTPLIKDIFRNTSVAQKIDSDANLEFLITLYGDLPPQLALTETQYRLLALQKTFIDLNLELKRIKYNIDQTAAEKKSVVLKNKDVLPTLNVKVNAFKKARASFNDTLKKRAFAIKTNIEDDSYFKKPEYMPYLQQLKIVHDATTTISPYLGILSGNYERIYIADTCAIMENPELIDSFKTNKFALIIPKQVLEELDKNKLKTDNDTNRKAQAAAKKIAECRDLKKMGQKWLFIEDSDISLLPQEYSDGHISGDDLILSVALKYRLNDPIILTNDVNLGNKLYGEYIRQQSSKRFMEENSNKGAKR